MPNPELIPIAKIVDAHGIRGQVRVRPLTELPETLKTLPALYNANGTKAPLIFQGKAPKGHLIAMLEGTADRTAAEQLKGTEFYAKRDDLPPPDEEEYYFRDIIGMTVIAQDKDTTYTGEVVDMVNFGAGDVLEVRWQNRTPALEMFAFTHATVPDIDETSRTLTLILPEELIAGDTPSSTYSS